MKKILSISLIFTLISSKILFSQEKNWGNVLIDIIESSNKNSKKNSPSQTNGFSRSNLINITFGSAFYQNNDVANHLLKSGIVRDLEEIIEKTLKVNKPINIYFVDDNTTIGNAYFMPSCNCIKISFDIIKKYASNASTTFTNINYGDAVNGAMSLILMHELAHYLIYNYDIPITGKEENAADQFAIMALLLASNYDVKFYNFAQLGIIGSFNDKPVNNREMVNVHAPTMERYYDMLTMFCGANLQNAKRLGLIGDKIFQLPTIRAINCEREYNSSAYTWRTLMKDYINL